MREDWSRPRRVDGPEPGFFELRLVKDGPLVGARIVHQDRMWQGIIDGVPCGAPHPDPAYAAGVYRIWHGAQRSDAETYSFRMELRAWALQHAPDHWAANPSRPIRLADAPALF